MCFCFITRKLTSNWISENGVALQKAMPIIWKHPVAPLDDDAWQDFCMSHRKMAIKKQNNARLGSVIELSPGFFLNKNIWDVPSCAWCYGTKDATIALLVQAGNFCAMKRNHRRVCGTPVSPPGHRGAVTTFDGTSSGKWSESPSEFGTHQDPSYSHVRHFEGALHRDI